MEVLPVLNLNGRSGLCRKVAYGLPRIDRKLRLQFRCDSVVISSANGNKARTMGEKTLYNDNWFDRLAIGHLSRSLESVTGFRSTMKGYDGLIESASMVARKYDKKKQREVVIESLNKAFPRPIITLIRTLLPHSKFTRECFALFTIIFCSWLIGPCEVKESSVDGRKEKNVVHIQKCRFLEGTNCVGMCLNLCKIPSQTYINDSLGVPVYMIPNFEDMSCEMVYGQQPPQEIEDPTLNQQCYHSLCSGKVKDSYDIDCCSP